uniref:GM2 ganglioside activator-like protein n=1 Tax=Philodina roseola TaxID=96448 RepID=B6S364_PHIRO|nr:GM2 ganglioside activator precursor-like protein [Philodina roseola]
MDNSTEKNIGPSFDKESRRGKDHMILIISIVFLIQQIDGATYQILMEDVDLNCLKDSSKFSPPSIDILGFNIWNNQVSVPGQLDFSLSFNVTKKLSSDLQLSAKIDRQMARIWVELPCLSGLGTCDQVKFCDFLQQACKVNQFIRPTIKGSNQKSCPCDLDPGIYTLEHAKTYLKYKKRAQLIKPLTTGKYRFKLNIFDNKMKKANVVGCVVGYLTLSKADKFS